MKHRPWTCAPLALAALTLLALAGPAIASEEIAQREDLVCTSCHDKPGSKLLTDKGKYYELMGSLEGFDDVAVAFESCTYCHVAKPGSKKLTKKGKSFAFAVGDMEGLRAWLRSEHPGLTEPLTDVENEEPAEEAAEGKPETASGGG